MVATDSPAEPNDIPLARLQYQFNERILAAATAQVRQTGRANIAVQVGRT